MTPYYQDDHVTIYLGDCLELIEQLETPDVVITDPPYGANTHKQAKTNRGSHAVKAITEFGSITYDELSEVLALSNPRRWMILTTEFRHAAAMEDQPPKGFELLRIGVWLKSCGGTPQISGDRPAMGWEAIAYLHNATEPKRWNAGGKHGNYYLPTVRDEHQSSKPLSMYRSFIERFTDLGDLVLDPFMGSGTTLRAAKDLGRKAIGIEIDEKYCEIAARRMGQEVLAL